jgi:protein-L-isoaspartate(D-aspartate) O-methyltransferase
MAWMSHGSCNDSLVDALIANRLVSPGSRVERALRAVDRAYFCPVAPYVDAPQRLAANATISAPHMHAHALALLAAHLRPGTVALDVGAGSGYLSAAMAEMVAGEPGAMVVAVEHVPELAEYARQNIARGCSPVIKECIKVVASDGRYGAPNYAPYGAIHVGAATPSIPQPLIDQLARGGRMVCPVGPEGGDQFLTVVDKKGDDTIETTRAFAVRYVPLCDVDHQLGMH